LRRGDAWSVKEERRLQTVFCGALTVGGVGGVVTALTEDDDDDDEIEAAAVGWDGIECGEGDDGGLL
jgi:hypothetical protein